MVGAGVKVLIVEDDTDILSLFEAGLAMRGYSIEIARNGRDALDHLASAEGLPAVIVADLHMPVMNGWQFLTALAEDPRLAGIPVIVLTAADDPSQSAPRPPTVLIKPVAMDALASAISAAASRGPSSPSVI